MLIRPTLFSWADIRPGKPKPPSGVKRAQCILIPAVFSSP